uniref:Glutamate-rich WD repeat-containing protein 1 n=1 Tax=Lygus hesperus TaxID=30085 RepID=A0A0A9XKN7_LYGHE
MDWSNIADAPILATGSCDSSIYVHQITSTGVVDDDQPFVGHTESVEDIQWSPTEKTVFITCSVDRTICVWDTRMHKKSAIQIRAHDTDINVISWNRYVFFSQFV